jgi:hypothetical protein
MMPEKTRVRRKQIATTPPYEKIVRHNFLISSNTSSRGKSFLCCPLANLKVSRDSGDWFDNRRRSGYKFFIPKGAGAST